MFLAEGVRIIGSSMEVYFKRDHHRLETQWMCNGENKKLHGRFWIFFHSCREGSPFQSKRMVRIWLKTKE
jgi:hypothetical protein